MEIDPYRGVQAPWIFMGVVSGLGLIIASVGLWNEGGAAAGFGAFLAMVGILGGTAWGLENLRNDRQAEESAE
ncbi:hypothetical protein CKO15_01245 [Halorhodospira abdelmalekii]|uniref:hypothetical protein n=1 Tax=Halorhodospira abdelmalekii TaxID=421629 RepID=UPI0019039D86|nr:hypothetical protein [Halorhodospira abdelmalekii]MBK1733926.1 hypothetical protein [Halorhodospira abdelmalekii]